MTKPLNSKILERIRKLLALSQSSNQHEAAIALNRAQKLMAEHGVTDIDLELADISREDVHACNSRKPPMWVVYLTSTIGEAFGCHPVIIGKMRGSDVAFIGPDPQPQIAKYAYEVLYRQVNAARTQHIQEQNSRIKRSTKTRRGDEFAKGWVIAVHNKIQKFANSEKTELLIAHFMEREFNELETAKGREQKTNRRDSASRVMGHIAGQKAQLNHGVAGEQRERLEVMA